MSELRQTRNLEVSAQDVKEHSCSRALPRYSLAEECRYFPDTWSEECVFQHEHCEFRQLSVETIALLLMMTGKLTPIGQNYRSSHKLYRRQLLEILSSKCPISYDGLESTRTTFIEGKNEWNQQGGEGWLESSPRSRTRSGSGTAWTNFFQDRKRSKTPKRSV